MRRFNLNLRFLLPLFILLGLVLSFSEPAPATEEEDETYVLLPEKKIPRLGSPTLYKQQKSELNNAISAYFEDAIASGDLLGAGVSIVSGDSIVLASGFGKRSVDSPENVDSQTIFRLGSLSKGFTGVLAAQVAGEGKISLGDRVKDFYPEFRLGNPSNTEQITLQNLLSHTSGAPYHSYTNLVEAGLPLEKILPRFSEVQPISRPGNMYSYQNALFALSGEMIKKATGEDLGTALKTRFFDRLGMNRAITDHASMLELTNVARPHVRSYGKWRSRKLNDHYYNALAAGGINASALDMAKWMRFLLGHNPELMDTYALEEVFKPVVEIKGRSKYYQRWPGHISSHYGLGWRIHKFREAETGAEQTIWHHGGSVNQFRNEIALFPESDFGICVLINSHTRLTQKVIPDLYRIIREVYQRPQVETASMYIPE
jgi:beta-lactamase class C